MDIMYGKYSVNNLKGFRIINGRLLPSDKIRLSKHFPVGGLDLKFDDDDNYYVEIWYDPSSVKERSEMSKDIFQLSKIIPNDNICDYDWYMVRVYINRNAPLDISKINSEGFKNV